jgi:hypothetical protein
VCSKMQSEHTSSENCIETKHFIKSTFVGHNNCIKVRSLDFP